MKKIKTHLLLFAILLVCACSGLIFIPSAFFVEQTSTDLEKEETFMQEKITESEEITYTPLSYEQYFTDLNISKQTITEKDFSGTGTEKDPYQVYTTKGFLYLSNTSLSGTLYNKYIELNCDVVLNDEIFDSDGNASGGDGKIYVWEPIDDSNNCSLNGNGHKISGMYFNNAQSSKQVGLFSYTMNEVNDVNFENVYLQGKDHVHSLCYSANLIKNCNVLSGTVKGNKYVAGISTHVIKIEKSANYAKIYATGGASSGVFYRLSEGGEAIQCHNYGHLYSNAGYLSGVGGLAKNSTFKYCNNYGKVEFNGYYSGGITSNCDYEGLMIIGCENYGEVIGTSYVGGIAASCNGEMTLKNCKNYGNVLRVSGETGYTGQIISFARTTDAKLRGTVVRLIGCEAYATSGNAFVGNMFGTADKITNLYIMNCRYKSPNLKANAICTVSAAANTYVEVNNMEANIDSSVTNSYIVNISGSTALINIKNAIVKIKGKASKLAPYNTNVTKLIEYDGIILEDSAKKYYYGENFSSFYVSWRTGKIGITLFDGRGTFQTKLTEEILIEKGYEKKSA